MCPAKGGQGASRNFPTCLSTLPSPSPPPETPAPLCTAAAGAARDARRPAAAPGRRELPTGKVSSPSVLFPTARAGPRGAASSALRGCLSASSQSGRCSRSCHSSGCAPARPPASHGPHRGLIGSANPRPCACSRRHLPLARPPGPRLPRPSPPRLAAAPETHWGPARELSAGCPASPLGASPPRLRLVPCRIGPKMGNSPSFFQPLKKSVKWPGLPSLLHFEKSRGGHMGAINQDEVLVDVLG